MVSLIVPLDVTVTLAFASAATACLVQARPRVAVPFLFCSTVQPAGSPRVPAIELAVMNSTIVSPAWTVAGSLMTWAERLPKLLAEPTYDNVGSAALAMGAGPAPSAARAATMAVMSTGTSRVRVRADAWCADMPWNPPLNGPSVSKPVQYLRPDVVVSPTRARNGSSPAPWGAKRSCRNYGAVTVMSLVIVVNLPQPSVAVSVTV